MFIQRKTKTPNSLYVLCGLIGVTCLVTCIAWNQPHWKDQLIYDRDRIREDGEWYRLFTACFCHINFFHLAFNMAQLLFFGQLLIQTWRISAIRLLVFYLGGCLFASFLGYLYDLDFRGNRQGLGASGGLCAVVAAAALSFPIEPLFAVIFGTKRKLIEKCILQVPMWLWLFSKMKKEYSLLDAHDGIGHIQHLGGFFYGFFFCLCWPKRENT